MKTEEKGYTVRTPKDVIGCLTAGFEMMGRNLLVVALPVVVDLFLWLGPRVSVRPLVQPFVDLLRVQSSSDPDVVGQVVQATDLLEQFGARFNLLSVAAGMPLLQVPSLLSRRASVVASPLGNPHAFSLSGLPALVPWWGGLALVGLILGFFYLNEIAHRVNGSEARFSRDESEPLGKGDGGRDRSVRANVWKFLRFILFAVGLLLVGSAVVPLWLLVVTLGTMVAQPLGILFWIAGLGFIGYAALHLIFVVPGLLLGERPLLRAIGESVLLSHFNLWSVLGLVVLVAVIYEGLGFAWSLPANDSWALLVGIAGNAFVATGLTSAAFLFYQDRLMLARQFSVISD